MNQLTEDPNESASLNEHVAQTSATSNNRDSSAVDEQPQNGESGSEQRTAGRAKARVSAPRAKGFKRPRAKPSSETAVVPWEGGSGPDKLPDGSVLDDLFTDEQRTELRKIEELILRNSASYRETGNGLARVSDAKLYRGDYRTFDEYLRKRFPFGRAQAFRFMAAAKSAGLIATMQGIPQPLHESQVRPLTDLSDDQAKKAWLDAVEAAGGKSPSARLVTKAAAQFKPAKEPVRRPWLSPEARIAVDQVHEELMRVRIALKQDFESARILPSVEKAFEIVRTLQKGPPSPAGLTKNDDDTRK